MSVRSKLIVGNDVVASEAPRVFSAYGDHDDPLRLAVLLTEHVGRLFQTNADIQDAAAICRNPRSSWLDRSAALQRALDLAGRLTNGHFIGFADIDALAPRATEHWTDDRTTRVRKDFLSILLASIDRGGWLVLRPSPDKRLSPDLADLDVDVVSFEAAPGTDIEEARTFSPECRPIASWLVRKGYLRPADLSRIIATVKEFDAYILRVAYDAASPDARDAGKLLSALRPPQHVNGALGPLAFSDAPVSAESVPKAAVDELRESGLLQPGFDVGTLRMPLGVRGMLASYAWLGMTTPIRKLHERLASEPIDARPTEDQIEVHFHAVRAGDVERAKATARFYGTELRDLATQLSLAANRNKDRQKFAEAAELFAFVVENFDERDAYAWEYLGYNLARAGGPASAAEARVLGAYERAHDLWRDNPLYHGRLLGFRGQLGQDITGEFAKWLDHYVRTFGEETDAVSFFAEAVFRGLWRGHQGRQRAKILKEKRAELERFAPRVLSAKPEAGDGASPSEEQGSERDDPAREL